MRGRSSILTLIGLLGCLVAALSAGFLTHWVAGQDETRPPPRLARKQGPPDGEAGAHGRQGGGASPSYVTDGGVLKSDLIEDRLNVLHKYRALAYFLPLLQTGAYSKPETGANSTWTLLRLDHRLLTGTPGSGTEGPPNVTAVRNSLDFTALEADSRTRAAERAGNHGQGAPAVHRRPIDRSALSFSAQQGLLSPPLPGDYDTLTVGKIGADAEDILHHGGLFFRAPVGEPIRSVFRGHVIFAEWFKEYGRVMIIDHGEHYCSLIAHADRLLKGVNDTVQAGEVVATVGRTGALKVPGLYFEIRHHGAQVDPLLWLKTDKTSKE